MYIHSWQSLVWNEIASRRVQLGLDPLPGDLVYVNEAAAAATIAGDELAEETAEGDEDDDNDDEAIAESDAEVVSRFRTMVRPLTAADISSGKYSLADVVLPLPGHDITYPTNECGEWYRERLARDNLSSEKLKQKQKYEYHLS